MHSYTVFLLSALLLLCDLVAGDPYGCDLTPDTRTSPPYPPLRLDNTTAAYIASSHVFSISLFKRIYNSSGNVFISPHSIWNTLALVYLGAAGDTREQMRAAMYLHNMSQTQVLYAYKRVQHYYQPASVVAPLTSRMTHNKFKVANRIYIDKSLRLSNCTSKHLVAEVRRMDFRGDSRQSRRLINEWVANRTNGVISDLLSPSMVNSQTDITLVNAAFFQGAWMRQFKPEDTVEDIFYRPDGTMTFVSMMKQHAQFRYTVSEQLICSILELPYVGNDVVMYILLPPLQQNSMAATIERLSADTLRASVQHMEAVPLTVVLPKFIMRQQYDLEEPLVAMGMRHLFDVARANLTQFSRTHRLHLSNAMHKSHIKLDEEGSRAAAVTAMITSRTSRPQGPSQFTCNHPFIYIIYDKNLGDLLFMGMFENPTSESISVYKKFARSGRWT